MVALRETISALARRPRLTIAAKLAAVMSVLSVLTMITIAFFMYNGTIDVLLSQELQRLKGGVNAAATRWQAGVEFYREDVVFLSKVPPLAGIIRASTAGGVDQMDGSTEAVWKSRLETIFVALLEAHCEYVQVRFIGTDNGGLEVVRVDRLADGVIRRVPDEELQRKAERPYYAGTLAIEPGEVFLSRIDLNEEFGEIEVPYRPMMRVATKALDRSGKLLGIVVINISMNDLVGTLKDSVRPGLSYITDDSGNYLYHPDEAKTYGHILGRPFTIQDEFPPLAIMFGAGRGIFAEPMDTAQQSMLTVAKRVYFDPVDPRRFITLTEMSPLSGLANQIGAVRDNTIALATLVLALELAAVVWISLLLTRPLRNITHAAQDVAGGRRDVDLGQLIQRHDETGDLARAFDVMVSSIAEKERELDERAQQLLHSNQELSQFAYVASHDLQEPLRMVASFLSLLQRRYAEQLNAEANEYIGFAVDGAARMKSLITDLLGYSRISNSPLHVSAVNLNETLGGITQLLGNRIAETGATVNIGVLPVLQADPGQMERLFRNLVDNALKYHGALAPRIDITAERQGNLWAFAIADNGIGIDPIYSEKVFAIFSRLHSRDKYQGTGIGLAACRRIVERHGGSIDVEPNIGGGSVFRFTLSAILEGEEATDGKPQERITD